MKNKYVHLRLCQWAEYMTKGNLASISDLNSGNGELHPIEVDSERLSWVKRTNVAVHSLERELRDVVMLRYLFSWSIHRIADRDNVGSSAIRKRLERAGHGVQAYFDELRS